MSYANAKAIPFVAIVGENEMNEGKVMLKNMATGEQNLGYWRTELAGSRRIDRCYTLIERKFLFVISHPLHMLNAM